MRAPLGKSWLTVTSNVTVVDSPGFSVPPLKPGVPVAPVPSWNCTTPFPVLYFSPWSTSAASVCDWFGKLLFAPAVIFSVPAV